MVVKIILFPPYSTIINKKKLILNFSEIEWVSFREIIKNFVKKYPKVKKIIHSISDEYKIYGNLVPVKNGSIVFLDDIIYDNEIIKFYGSLIGG